MIHRREPRGLIDITPDNQAGIVMRDATIAALVNAISSRSRQLIDCISKSKSCTYPDSKLIGYVAFGTMDTGELIEDYRCRCEEGSWPTEVAAQ